MGLRRRLRWQFDSFLRRRPLIRWSLWLLLGVVISRLVLLGAMFLWSLILLTQEKDLTGSAAELRTFDAISLVVTTAILWFSDRAWLRRFENGDESSAGDRTSADR